MVGNSYKYNEEEHEKELVIIGTHYSDLERSCNGLVHDEQLKFEQTLFIQLFFCRE